MEKNRFVLEHKIENLKQQILPKDDLIRDLRSQIDAMEDELNSVTKIQAELEVTIDETKTKLSSATQELSQERKRASNMSVVQFRLFKGPVHVIYTGRRMLKLVLNVKCL